MGKDEYYERVDHLTAAAMEKLSPLTGSLTEFMLAHYQAIKDAGEQHLSEEERTGLINLSFFYFLATCIDFLLFLHLRHRNVNIYEHELEHILSVMITHARQQREEFKATAGPHAHPMPESVELDWSEFERELRRYSEELGGGEGHGTPA